VTTTLGIINADTDPRMESAAGYTHVTIPCSSGSLVQLTIKTDRAVLYFRELLAQAERAEHDTAAARELARPGPLAVTLPDHTSPDGAAHPEPRGEPKHIDLVA
jgi:hypothetical protein